MSSQVILVTGATRGIGRALGEELSRRGHVVYGGGRSWAEGDELGFTGLALDVTDAASTTAAVARIMDEHGRLDVLVNNAGISHAGPVEETPVEVARQVFETNYVGLVLMTQAALPAMRSAGSGLIVNVTSAAGKIGIPFQAHYAASKFAAEGLSEGLKHELASFGIKVVVIEPGDVGTDIWRSSERRPAEGSAYGEALARFYAVKAKEMGGGASPVEGVARDMADFIERPGGRFRKPVAKGAAFFLLARKLLPERVFLWAVGRNYS